MPLRSLFLASKSPRRRELLYQIGVAHELIDVDVDETPDPGETAQDLVRRLAQAKAQAGERALMASGSSPNPAPYCVMGADTVVVCDDDILGKPSSQEQAVAMLSRLSGRGHRVMTSAALAWEGRLESRLCISEVEFRRLSITEITAYCAGGEPMDKAGAYGIQGAGGLFVVNLQGSYSGVMGLALHHVDELLRAAGRPPLV